MNMRVWLWKNIGNIKAHLESDSAFTLTSGQRTALTNLLGGATDILAVTNALKTELLNISALITNLDSYVLKENVVAQDVTVAGNSATGTVTDTDFIDGVIMGAYAKSGVDSNVKAVALNTTTGEVTVTLKTAQGEGVDAVVTVMVLTVPAET